MDLESVIQSEVSQKEENKYCMLTNLYGSKKEKKRKWSEEPTGKMRRKTQTY